ncbi:hypothetical protein HNR61_002051 [Actinomadura namibiensis]|uniref:Uncharacterized protein n=2 Tax=Actinomadura TaxID=1988 RepID=A0A7W3LLS9_ACTNM|nr:hypothetical protein [Actinomadura namibiensis]MBA8950438.1 hypothetical protein [Actinomadura namibiensis]
MTMPQPYPAPYPPPGRPRNGVATAVGCVSVGLATALLLVSCSVLLSAGSRGDGREPPAGPVTRGPTASRTATAVPRPDAAARRMCRYAARSVAHRAAGNAAEAARMRTGAQAAARASGLPAVKALGAGGLTPMWTWCRANVPDVEPPRLPKRPRPTGTATTRPPEADVRPGAFCSPAGATGAHRGRGYVCKGPGRPRWRR